MVAALRARQVEEPAHRRRRVWQPRAGGVDVCEKILQHDVASGGDVDVAGAGADDLKKFWHDLRRGVAARREIFPEQERARAGGERVERLHAVKIRGAKICAGGESVSPRLRIHRDRRVHRGELRVEDAAREAVAQAVEESEISSGANRQHAGHAARARGAGRRIKMKSRQVPIRRRCRRGIRADRDVAAAIDDLRAGHDRRHARESRIRALEKIRADRRRVRGEEAAVRLHAALHVHARADRAAERLERARVRDASTLLEIPQPVAFHHDARRVRDRARDRRDIHAERIRRLRRAQVQRAGEFSQRLRRRHRRGVQRRIGDRVHLRDRERDRRAALNVEHRTAAVIHVAIDLRARLQTHRAAFASGAELLGSDRERRAICESEVAG